MKIKTITAAHGSEAFDAEVNNFIKDKEVIKMEFFIRPDDKGYVKSYTCVITYKDRGYEAETAVEHLNAII